MFMLEKNLFEHFERTNCEVCFPTGWLCKHFTADQTIHHRTGLAENHLFIFTRATNFNEFSFWFLNHFRRAPLSSYEYLRFVPKFYCTWGTCNENLLSLKSLHQFSWTLRWLVLSIYHSSRIRVANLVHACASSSRETSDVKYFLSVSSLQKLPSLCVSYT